MKIIGSSPCLRGGGIEQREMTEGMVSSTLSIVVARRHLSTSTLLSACCLGKGIPKVVLYFLKYRRKMLKNYFILEP
ncbi:MAG: hypothetical protein AAGC45_08130 [Bacteroidota bacterium]